MHKCQCVGPVALSLCRVQFYVVAIIAIITGRMPQSGKLLVLNLLTGHKSGFFAPQGRLVAPIHVKLHMADGLGPLGCTKFHLNRRRGGNAA